MFTYRVSDGALTSSIATVTVSVLDEAPRSSDDEYTVGVDGSLTASDGVLRNDLDFKGDPLTATLGSAPSHGTVAFNADGSFVYTPAAGFEGADAFTYQADDGTRSGNVATVQLSVFRDPVGVSDWYYLKPGDNVLTVTADKGVLRNDFTQGFGGQPTVEVAEEPQQGTLTLQPTGAFTYTRPAGVTDMVTFKYRIKVGTKTSAPVTVFIFAVAPENAYPVATTLSFRGGRDVLPDTPNLNGMPATYQAPQYVRSEPPALTVQKQYPYSIARSKKLTINAEFVCDPDWKKVLESVAKRGDLWVRGEFHDETTSPSYLFSLTDQNPIVGGKLRAAVTADATFAEAGRDRASRISFRVEWAYSIDKGQSWVFLLPTENHSLYVTLDEPKTQNVFDTVLWYGAVGVANFADLPGTVMTQTNFAGLNVTRRDGTPLHYYKKWSFKGPEAPMKSTPKLFSIATSQCGSWATFFIDILRAQGMQVPNTAFTVARPTRQNAGEWLMVPNWEFIERGLVASIPSPLVQAVSNRYPFINVPKGVMAGAEARKSFPYWEDNEYKWRMPVGRGREDAKDIIGVSGQNTANPASLFSNHALVEVNQVFYDPSYGNIYRSFQDFDNSLAGFYIGGDLAEQKIGYDLNGDGVKSGQVRVFLTRKKTVGQTDLREDHNTERY